MSCKVGLKLQGERSTAHIPRRELVSVERTVKSLSTTLFILNNIMSLKYKDIMKANTS